MNRELPLLFRFTLGRIIAGSFGRRSSVLPRCHAVVDHGEACTGGDRFGRSPGDCVAPVRQAQRQAVHQPVEERTEET